MSSNAEGEGRTVFFSLLSKTRGGGMGLYRFYLTRDKGLVLSVPRRSS